VQVLSEQPQTVDFAYYRDILSNRAVIDEVENAVKGFKVQSYDVSRQLKAIDAFEAQAVKNAEETAGLVATELQDLEKTLKNIESARPFDELTVVCSEYFRTLEDLWLIRTLQDEVMAAEPAIEKRVEKMVSNHRWVPAGYKVWCIGDSFQFGTNTFNRRSSAICPCCKHITYRRPLLLPISLCNGRCAVNFINAVVNIMPLQSAHFTAHMYSMKRCFNSR